MEKSLTSGGIFRVLVSFAVPVFMAMLIQALYGTADLLIVGRFGDATGVSAVSTGSQIMQSVTDVVTGLTTGVTVYLGQNIGRRDDEAAARTIGSSIWLFVIFGMMLSALLYFSAGGISRIMHAPAEAFDKTVSYVAVCSLGTVFIVLFNGLSGIFRGTGNSVLPLVLVSTACVVNVIGDLILVGVMGLGSTGAAIATVSAQCVSVAAAFIIMFRRGFSFSFRMKHLKPHAKEITGILRFGLPIAMQDALTDVSFLIILSILNGFGLIASAGVGVAEKICALIFIVPMSFMSSLSAFTAQNVGAGKWNRAKKALVYSCVLSVSLGLIMFCATFFSGSTIASVFTDDTAVMAACGDYLRTYSIDCVLVGIVFSFMGFFNGCGKTLFVALQGILSAFLVRIPFSYIMSRVAGVSLFEIGFAAPLASLFSIVMCFIYYFANRRHFTIMRS